MLHILAAPAFLFVLLVTQPTFSAAQCSGPQQNCNVTKCCTDKAMTCYEKNKEFADCRAECAPGIHKDDDPKWATAWSCNQLSTGCAVAFQPCGGTTGKTCCEGCTCNGACQPPMNKHTCAAGIKVVVAKFLVITDDAQSEGHDLDAPVGVVQMMGTPIAMGTSFFAAVTFVTLVLWKQKRHQTVRSLPLNAASMEVDTELTAVQTVQADTNDCFVF